MPSPSPAEPTLADRGAWAVFLIFLRLGLTSFSGPVGAQPFWESLVGLLLAALWNPVITSGIRGVMACWPGWRWLR